MPPSTWPQQLKTGNGYCLDDVQVAHGHQARSLSQTARTVLEPWLVEAALGLASYKATMRELGNAEKQEIGRWANSRVENIQLSFRRRERAMLRFRQMKSLQKFASVHANVHNHFNQECHVVSRQGYKTRCSAALAERSAVMA